MHLSLKNLLQSREKSNLNTLIEQGKEFWLQTLIKLIKIGSSLKLKLVPNKKIYLSLLMDMVLMGI